MSEYPTYSFTAKGKKSVMITLVVGICLLAFGIAGLSQGWWGTRDDGHAHGSAVHETAGHEKHEKVKEGHGEGEEHGAAHAEGHAECGHKEYSWTKRVKADFWHNSVMFAGIAIIGVFFFAVNYLAWAGWSAILSRIALAFGYFLPIALACLLIGFFAFGHDLFHWTHEYLYDENGTCYDPIIAGKEGFLNTPFYLIRMVLFFGIWMMFWFFMKRECDKEDVTPGKKHYNKIIKFSAGFIVFFGFSSSVGAWDWVMSIDTHWFSTMFGWYTFASWFVMGLSTLTLVILALKKWGYLPMLNASHLHNMGLFMFAFSVFWTYIWFSQFILIYYANIPEESIWFVERMYNNMGVYAPLFVLNLLINFLFPFLFFMTRNSKRQTTLLKVGACALILGHWFDFYLMIMPGTINEYGGLDLGTLFVELGMTMTFAAIFAGTIMFGLSRRPLIAKNHPMLEESLHHSY